jgi:hypothetical protein
LAKRGPKIAHEGLGLVRDLPPGDPYHPPPGGDQDAIALAICLKRARGPVHRPAVELDDQTGFAPSAIDLERAVAVGEPSVHLRPWESIPANESEKLDLEVVARADALVSEDRADLSRASATRVALQEGR